MYNKKEMLQLIRRKGRQKENQMRKKNSPLSILKLQSLIYYRLPSIE